MPFDPCNMLCNELEANVFNCNNNSHRRSQNQDVGSYGSEGAVLMVEYSSQIIIVAGFCTRIDVSTTSG